MVHFSGWIKYLLRWALLIILFLQCLKRSQVSAFWKQLSPARTWRMYESDTRVFIFPWTGNSWIRAMTILDFCDQLWIQKKKNHQTKTPLWTLLVSRFFVYIVTYYCKVDLQGLVQRGRLSQTRSLSERVPEGSSCSWTSADVERSLFPQRPLAESRCWWSLLFAGSLQYIL